MTYRIYQELSVKTTVDRCFDLSRSIDFHKDSMDASEEVPVSGRTTGLIELGEFVEWEATHLFVRQRLSSKIIEMDKPHVFVDVMVKGAFKSFWHRHEILVHKPGEVLMIDDFQYEVPFGIAGRFANFLFLYKYMKNLLGVRAERIKSALESDEWKKYLPDSSAS